MLEMQKLHIIEQGCGQPCVLLHGFGFHAGIWHELQLALSQSANTLAVDLPGFGHSSWMPWTQFYEALADRISSPVWLVGWSLGGMLAIEFAHLYPQKVKGLFLLATNPCFVASPDWPGILPQRLQTFKKELQTDYDKTLLRFLSLQWPKSYTSRTAIRAMHQRLRETPKPSACALESALEYLTSKDLRQALAGLNCAVQLILGRLDAFVPQAIQFSLAQRCPHIKVQVQSEAAHAPFLSHQDAVLRELRKCLNAS